MNTLYKVWGIITYVFTGFYALGWVIAFVLMGIGFSEAKSAVPQYAYYMWRAMRNEFAQAHCLQCLNLAFALLRGKAGFVGFTLFSYSAWAGRLPQAFF